MPCLKNAVQNCDLARAIEFTLIAEHEQFLERSEKKDSNKSVKQRFLARLYIPKSKDKYQWASAITVNSRHSARVSKLRLNESNETCFNYRV